MEHDYCYCLCYFTNNKLSKPNYKIEAVSEVILESVGEYKEEGYNEATRKAIEWLKENGGSYQKHYYDLPTDDLVNDFRRFMEGE